MHILETPRLFLRKLTLDDVDNLLGIFADPEAMKYYPKTKDQKETEAWIQRNLESYRMYGFGFWAAILKDSREFAGECGLIHQENVDGYDEVELGYSFLRKFWNRGLATEAAKVCLRYAFDTPGYERIVSLIDPHNIASQRVAQKIGMTWEKEIERWEKKIYVYSTDFKGLSV